MNFSKTTSYSINILAFMAQNARTKMSAGFLHKKLNIPYSYLRQVLNDLSKSGFIKGLKGRDGGFILTKEISRIYLADIISETEGLESFEKCIMGFDTCPFNNPCAMHAVWSEARTNILDTLKSTALSDLVNKVVIKY